MFVFDNFLYISVKCNQEEKQSNKKSSLENSGNCREPHKHLYSTNPESLAYCTA